MILHHLICGNSQQCCNEILIKVASIMFSFEPQRANSMRLWAILVTKPRVSVQSPKTGFASSVSAWPRDFLLASAVHSAATQHTTGFLSFLIRLGLWPRSHRNPQVIKAGPTFPQLSVRGDLRITEGQDVEAKAIKCLREGAGAEEEGEFFWLL